MFINKVTMNIMINLIQMLLIFVFEIRPHDRLQNDSDAMTVFITISLFPRDQFLFLFLPCNCLFHCRCLCGYSVFVDRARSF